MKTAIQLELELAQSKMIEEVGFNGSTLAKLTRDNVAIVEAMIRNDSAYIRMNDISSGPEYNKNGKLIYGGSSAYWMTQLKRYLTLEGGGADHSYEEIVRGAVEAVDRENSTHLNADSCGRDEIIKRILSLPKKELLTCLRQPDHNDLKLVRLIAKITSAEKRARTNWSFASKFCHYACFFLFDGMKSQDNYSIYDSILRNVLPKYLEYYEIKEQFDLSDYKQYQQAIDRIREACEVEISRNGFDHLLWYYHKGRV